MNQKISKIEALLFVAGEDGLTVGELAKVTAFDKGALPSLLEELATELIQMNSPLMLRTFDGRYSLVTRPEYGSLVSAYFDLPVNTKLTKAQLETLVIVAYQQPITRVEIDQIRGVRSAGTIQKLLAHQLIDTVGRKEEIGRPILYGTTGDFLNYFGLESLDQLPTLPDINEVTLSEASQAEVALFDQIDDQGKRVEESKSREHKTTGGPDILAEEASGLSTKQKEGENA